MAATAQPPRTPSHRSTTSPGRPGLRSTFSFSSKRSDKSWRNKDTKPTVEDLTESPGDKKRLISKADPTLAMNEEEPAVAAAGLSVNYESIRLLQHRDFHGNVITDPDRSNPTRSRWERPLDTIRAFEAAIDDRHRRSYMPQRSDSSDALSSYGGRRSSYHQDQPRKRPISRHFQGPDGMQYANGHSTPRPDSYQQSSVPPNSYYNPSRARFNQRMQSEPVIQNDYNNSHYLNNANGQGIYPSPAYQQSYDTVASSSGSGSASYGTADYWTNSTDPSSENSSVDRITPAGMAKAGPPAPPAHDAYNYPMQLQQQQQQHQQPPPQMNYGNYGQNLDPTNGGYLSQRGNSPVPPVPPPKSMPVQPQQQQQQVQRKPIRLNSTLSHSESYANDRPVGQEKRRSWFKRFSRSGQ